MRSKLMEQPNTYDNFLAAEKQINETLECILDIQFNESDRFRYRLVNGWKPWVQSTVEKKHNWQKLVEDKSGSIYFESNFLDGGKQAHVWILENYGTAQEQYNKNTRSVLTESMVNCVASKKLTLISTAEYSGQMARGDLISGNISSNSGLFARAIPDVMLQLFCK